MNKFAILLVLMWIGPAPATDKIVRLDENQVAALGIETQAVEAVDKTLSKDFPAEVVVPNSQLRIVGSPLDGFIEALIAAEGESVKKGQPLAHIRSARLLELQAAYLETRTRRLLSGETLARERKLRSEGITAERRLLEAESAFRELLSAEERDRQSLQLAGMSEEAIEELARTGHLSSTLAVHAPLNGVVLEQMAAVGKRVATGDPLYRIGDLSRLWIEIHVPLDSLGSVVPGSTVFLPEQALQAQVITVGRMVHDPDQGVLVRALVTQGVEQLRPGQFVKARLAQETGKEAMRVPTAAVVRIGSQSLVFIQQKEGFVPVPVQILQREDTHAVVAGSLSKGDRVAIRGTATLKAALAAGAD